MATQGNTQNVTDFLKKLRELDAVTTARQYVPKANSTFKDLETVIEGHLDSMTTYFAGFPDECRLGSNDRVRLEKAYNRLEGLVKSQKMARDILLGDLQKGLQCESLKDPTSESIRAQRSILDIWQTLKSEKIDNKNIEDAVLRAMASHDRTIETANSLVDRRKKKVPVKAEAKVNALPQPWSIQVLSAIFPEPRRSFRNVRLIFEKKSEDGIMVLLVSGDGIDEKDPKTRTTVRSLTGLKHSTCKQFIRLSSSIAARSMFDVRLVTTSDGERLIDYVRNSYKNACPIESSEDLEGQVKNRDQAATRPKSAPPKRSIDAVSGSEASSQACKASKSSMSSKATSQAAERAPESTGKNVATKPTKPATSSTTPSTIPSANPPTVPSKAT